MAAVSLKQYIDALVAQITIAFSNSTALAANESQILINNQTLTETTIVNSGQNSLCLGPLQIVPGVTLTLAQGSKMRILL